MASQFASGKVPVLTRKLNAADSTAYLDSDVGITSGRLYLSNNLQEEWVSFSGVAASGSEFAYSGLVRGLSQTADPATASTGKTWLAGQQCALVEMHDQMMNKQRPEPKVFATTAARDSALGADGAATSPWVNVYVTDTGLHYNYSLGTNQWEAIDTGTVTPNASETVAGKVEIATSAESIAGTNTGGTGALLSVLPSDIAANSQSWTHVYAAAADVSDTYTASLVPALTAYATWMTVTIKFTTANTGACTLNLNGLGAKNIKTILGLNPQDNDILAGSVHDFKYDGTNFVLDYATSTIHDATKDAIASGSSSYSDSTAYLAATSWFVTAYVNGWAGATLQGFTDSANPPTVKVAESKFGSASSVNETAFICFPVKSGDYWKVVGSSTRFFFPMQ